jgi:hypothetical protein
MLQILLQVHTGWWTSGEAKPKEFTEINIMQFLEAVLGHNSNFLVLVNIYF